MMLFHELQIPSDFDENKNYLEKWISKHIHKMLDDWQSEGADL